MNPVATVDRDQVIQGTPQVYAAPGARYLLGDDVWSAEDERFANALAQAWRRQVRLSCLCQRQGDSPKPGELPGMYIARVDAGFIVKRLPGTGHLHATDCFSYEGPGAGPGKEDQDGSMHAAVMRDERTGLCRLRLGFALSHQSRVRDGSLAAPEPTSSGTLTRRPDRLTLEGLLRLLWQEAELTRWHPALENKRPWGLVRELLLLAAQTCLVQGRPLTEWLYVPEPFSVEGIDQIIRRRREFWSRRDPGTGRAQQVRLLIGELKAIEPTCFGAKVMVKHMPDQGLVLNTSLWRQLEARHQQLLIAWSTRPGQRIVMAATHTVTDNWTPVIESICLMETGRNWVSTQGDH